MNGAVASAPMLLGALGSALAAALRFLRAEAPPSSPSLLARVSDLIASVYHAQALADLDGIVARIAAEARPGRRF